jgi:hypothetical protein
MGYKGQEMPFTVETFNELVPTSPQQYREREQFELNEMRTAAGIPNKTIYNKGKKDKALEKFLLNAGI